MSDIHTSGANSVPGAGPSQTDGQAPAAASDIGAFGAFPTGAVGAVRGSGLARGKRTSSPAASAAPAAHSGEYKPTALEVIVTQREYKNPFAEETAATPAAETPAPVAAVAPVAPVARTFTATPAVREYITPQPAAESEPLPERPTPAEATIAHEDEADESEETAQPELTILPPAQSAQPALSWENGSAAGAQAPIFPLTPGGQGQREPRGDNRGPRRDGRPDQREPRAPRPENREASSEPRPPRPDHREPRADGRGPRPDGREQRYGQRSDGPRTEGHRSDGHRSDGREPRREGREGFRPREEFRSREQAAREIRPAPVPPPRGFLAWLKGLFGAKPAATTPSARADGPRPQHDGEHRGRRRRGGRGRHGGEHRGGGFNAEHGGGEQGHSPEGGQRAPGGEPREHRGDYPGGERRRSRGGRGRGRGRDDRGGPRSEGSQGGGAI